MNIDEFNQKYVELKKKEFLKKETFSSTTYENNEWKLIEMDEGYTVILINNGIEYLRNYKNEIKTKLL